MTAFDFETIDSFTGPRLRGDPLAVFSDARGLDLETLPALAAEPNLSEAAFVLAPEDSANTVRVRIFNRTRRWPSLGIQAPTRPASLRAVASRAATA